MLQRHIQSEVEAYLKVLPAVLLAGARQTGKTTLAEFFAQTKGYHFFTFDDEMTRMSAQADPAGWLASSPKPMVIDEIQRVPELFLALKRDIDQQRVLGRYLLTGSANPLLLPQLGDSLAGRLGIVPMFPLSQGELKERSESFIPFVFGERLSSPKYKALSVEELCQILLRGGFPAVMALPELRDVGRWVHSYLQAMRERDVRDISNIEGLRDFPRLFRLLATRSSSLLNVSDLSRSLGLVNVTLNRYMRLLEILYFIYLLPAWYCNRAKRLIKSPKLHLCDTAILAQLLHIDEQGLTQDAALRGQFVESFVFAELLKQKSWAPFPVELYHFRDGDREVDLVLEKPDGTIVGIEVKSASTIRPDDLKGLLHLKALGRSHFKRGIVLYQGTQAQALAEGIWALPLQALWQA